MAMEPKLHAKVQMNCSQFSHWFKEKLHAATKFSCTYISFDFHISTGKNYYPSLARGKETSFPRGNSSKIAVGLRIIRGRFMSEWVINQAIGKYGSGILHTECLQVISHLLACFSHTHPRRGSYSSLCEDVNRRCQLMSINNSAVLGVLQLCYFSSWLFWRVFCINKYMVY